MERAPGSQWGNSRFENWNISFPHHCSGLHSLCHGQCHGGYLRKTSRRLVIAARSRDTVRQNKSAKEWVGGREAGSQGGRDTGRQGGTLADRHPGRVAGRQGGRELGTQEGR